jgi:hypothetical protein
MHCRINRLVALLFVTTMFSTRSSLAQEGPPAIVVIAPPPLAPPPPPAPYSLPFQLRPVTAATALRSDTSFAKYENAGGDGGFAVVSELGGSFRIPGTGATPGTGLAPIVKLTIVGDSPPPGTMAAPTTGGYAFVNPLVGASYAFSFGSGFRASAFLGFTIPIGMGGGDDPGSDAGALDARNIGPVVRAAMDNALFAVNDFTVIPGIDVAYVAHGLTVQLEATFFQLERVRGSGLTPAGVPADPDASKTNFTGGLHVGYFILPVLSIGAELRYQDWIKAPATVQKDTPGTSFDQVSIGVGPRLHFDLGHGVWIRPGIAYTRGFEPPMSTPGNDNIFQLDIPVVF